MNEIFLELLKSSGGTGLVIAALVAVIWNAATTWLNFNYMKKSMVTKKDLAITMLNHELKSNEKYITRTEFAEFVEHHHKPAARGASAH